MDSDATIGCIVLVCSLGLIVYLTLYSRKTINWIATTGRRSSREIMKELNGDR